MNGNQHWYERPGWRSCWGFGAYLLYLPPLLIAVATGFGWHLLLLHLLERYDWFYFILYWLSWIPYGWLIVPLLVIGVTVVPGVYLCYFIHKHTDWGKARAGTTVLVYAGITLVAMGLGIFFGSLNL